MLSCRSCKRLSLRVVGCSEALRYTLLEAAGAYVSDASALRRVATQVLKLDKKKREDGIKIGVITREMMDWQVVAPCISALGLPALEPLVASCPSICQAHHSFGPFFLSLNATRIPSGSCPRRNRWKRAQRTAKPGS